MQEVDPCKKLTLLKREGTRHIEKHKMRWLESDGEHLKNMGMRNWMRKSQDPKPCRAILEEAKVHQGL
jgi:hypothetical protein